MKYFPITISIVLICMFFPLQGFTQSENQRIEITYQPLKVGDTVPNDVFNNLINYKTESVRLSDFKGKLLILDFWVLGCPHCIKTWPKLLELQQKFEGKIQIMLVNPKNDKTSILRYIENKRNYSKINMNLPSFFKGSKIDELFPTSSFPRIIWIDKNGIVKSIAYGGGSLTNENIEAMLNGQDVKMKQARVEKPQKNVIYEKPFYLDGNVGNGEHMLWYSVVSRYNENVIHAEGIFANDTVGYFITQGRHSIYEMIQFVFNEGPFFLNNFPSCRIDLQVKDRTRLFAYDGEGLGDGKFRAQNYYSYQLFSKLPKTKKKLKQLMQADLERYFDIKFHWENREMDCLVLTAEDTSLISYKKGEKEYYSDPPILILNNIGLDDWLIKLNNVYPDYPIINETGLKGNLGDISLNVNLREGYQALDKALKKYKMRFKMEKRIVKVLVVTDPEGYEYIEREPTPEEKKLNDKVAAQMILMKIRKSEDFNTYQKEIIRYVNTHLQDNWEELNQYAWSFYKNEKITSKNSLEQAINWARRSIELDSNYYNNDTYAHLLFKVGRKKEALNAAKKAIELASKSDKKIDVKVTQQLINKIKGELTD